MAARVRRAHVWNMLEFTSPGQFHDTLAQAEAAAYGVSTRSVLIVELFVGGGRQPAWPHACHSPICLSWFRKSSIEPTGSVSACVRNRTHAPWKNTTRMLPSLSVCLTVSRTANTGARAFSSNIGLNLRRRRRRRKVKLRTHDSQLESFVFVPINPVTRPVQAKQCHAGVPPGLQPHNWPCATRVPLAH